MIVVKLLKRLVHIFVLPILSYLNKQTRHNKDIILLYTNLGLRDNVLSLLEYLISEKYYEKYKIICSTSDYKIQKSVKYNHIKIISNVQGVLEYFRAGYVYYCFANIPILPGKGQIVVQMWHGTPLKDITKQTPQIYYTHIFSPSKHFIPIFAQAFHVPESHIVVCGCPRNDKLFTKSRYNDLGEYDKLILWVPTFRNSTLLHYDNGSQFLPILTKKSIPKFNEYLKTQNVKIIVKLHPIQTLDRYELLAMENFLLLSHVDFEKRGYDLYELASQSDALITDYSSIYFDYLLLNRPIAFTEDDIDEYQQKRGFIMNNPEDYKPGFKIRNEEDLLSFVDSLVKGIDMYQDDRVRVNDLANDCKTPNNCENALKLVGITKDA